jgi:hypothetical protein
MDFSLDDLDATKSSEKPFEFELVNSAGDGIGVFLRVLGSQSATVSAAINKAVNDKRRREASRAVQARIGVGAKAVQFDTLEDDVAFGQHMASVRLVGWRGPGETAGLDAEQLARFRGITDPWSPENSLRLCRSNRDVAAQVTLQSDAIGNFT